VLNTLGRTVTQLVILGSTEHQNDIKGEEVVLESSSNSFDGHGRDVGGHAAPAQSKGVNDEGDVKKAEAGKFVGARWESGCNRSNAHVASCQLNLVVEVLVE